MPDDTIFTEMSFESKTSMWLVASMSVLEPATMWTTSVPSEGSFGLQ